MRDISSIPLTQTLLGTEPVYYLTVYWSSGTINYLDKSGEGAAPTYIGAVQEVSNLNFRLDAVNQSHSTEISFSLLDSTDQTRLLAKLKTENTYNINIEFSLTYDTSGTGTIIGTTLVLFKGKLATISWSEANQTMSFSFSEVRYENQVGYVPSVDDYLYSNESLGDRPWPLCFGNVRRVPATKISNILHGTTENDLDSSDDFSNSSNTTLQVTNGSDFPQDVNLSVVLDGLDFTGSFSGDTLTLLTSLLPKYTNVSWGARDTDDIGVDSYRYAWLHTSDYAAGVRLQGLWCIRGNRINFCVSQNGTRCIFRYAWEKALTGSDTDIAEASAYGMSDWGSRFIGVHFPGSLAQTKVTAQSRWQIPAGSKVFISGEEVNVAYIANTDSNSSTSVVEVMAYRSINNKQVLSHIPSSYYTIDKAYNPGPHLNTDLDSSSEQIEAGVPKSCCAIILDNDLSYYKHELWEDEVYVSMTCKETGNAADAIKYLLEDYATEYTTLNDFSTAITLLANFPVNFALLERRNVLNICRELAYQSGHALRIGYDTVDIISLLEAVEPSAVKELDDTNIELDTISIGQTDYFDIYTIMNVNYRKDYISDMITLKLKNNIDTYGEVDIQETFWSFSNPVLVKEMANFWLDRYSRSWRTITFTTFIDSLDLEVFDRIDINLSDDLLGTGVVKGVIQNISHNTLNNKITMTCWLPVESGTIVNPAVEAWTTLTGDSTNPLAGLAIFDYTIEQTKQGFTKSHGAFQGGGGTMAEDEITEEIIDEIDVNLFQLAVVVAISDTEVDATLTNGGSITAVAIFVDGSININDCLPDLQVGVTIVVAKHSGVWYMIYPTLTASTSECAE